MKKLVCLLAVLALAAGASAASVDVISSGVFQNIWGGTNTQGYGGPAWAATTAPGGAAAIGVTGASGWTTMGINQAGAYNADISGNDYLEYLVYFDTTGGYGSYSECANFAIDGANQQFQAVADLTITDMATGVAVTHSGYSGTPTSDWGGGNKWIHVKLYLQNNNWGAMGSDLVVDSVGALRFGAYNVDGRTVGQWGSIKAYITDMKFSATGMELVPEPATIALLGFGALSLIRRKR